MSHVELPAQFMLQPFVQFATHCVPPEHEQVPASGSHAQLPVQASTDVTSLPSPSMAASLGATASLVDASDVDTSGATTLSGVVSLVVASIGVESGARVSE